ncbi:MAG: FAD-binding oxidoreductase, partial [Isosphaeraceae bacterium]
MLGGEMLFEPLERAPYAHDASLYQSDPLGVVVPNGVEDVIHTLRYAAENGIPVHARGAATGVSGGGIGPGLVVDFSRHFRRVVEIHHDRVVVQAGVVLDDLNARLAPMGRRIGPDPKGSDVATIGGIVGVNAIGPCSVRYGATGDVLDQLRVVFANGETATLGQELWPAFDDEADDYKTNVVRKLGALVRKNLDLLMRFPRGGRAGYALAKAATGVGIHLPRLIAGSQGTLGLVTEATLRTVPIATAQVAILLPFGRLLDASEAAAAGLGSSLSACELFDWRLIHLAREANPRFKEWIADAAEAALVLLFEGDEPDEVAGRARALSARIARQGKLVADPVLVNRRADCELMIAVRKSVEPLLMRLGGPTRPTTLFEEVSVPPERLADLIQRLQGLMREHNVSWVVDAHAAQGRLHPRPFLNLADEHDVGRLDSLSAAIFEAARDLGGTALGAGLGSDSGASFARKQLGALLPVYREVKLAFDPLNILNPSAIVGDEGTPSSRLLRLPYSPPPPGEDATLDAGSG